MTKGYIPGDKYATWSDPVLPKRNRLHLPAGSHRRRASSTTPWRQTNRSRITTDGDHDHHASDVIVASCLLRLQTSSPTGELRTLTPRRRIVTACRIAVLGT